MTTKKQQRVRCEDDKQEMQEQLQQQAMTVKAND
jgi:hypothetical protein